MENIEWLTMEELMGYLKISRQSVLNCIDKKGLPGHKLGKIWRFDKAEVNDWVKANEGVGGAE